MAVAQIEIINCLFTGNQAQNNGKGGAVQAAEVVNSICWDNSATTNPEIAVASGTLTVNHSDIEGGWSGSGGNNKNINPNFDSNYRLQCGSACVNAGQDSSVSTDALDVNEDGVTGEDAPDLDLLTRIVTVVDMGAYEKQPEFCIADISNNGVVKSTISWRSSTSGVPVIHPAARMSTRSPAAMQP